jgi:hypothetical protein
VINVVLHTDGRGFVGLPTRTVPLDAPTISVAREQAVTILTDHAASQDAPFDVQALDAGSAIGLTVHPDGRVVVHPRYGSVHAAEAGDAPATSTPHSSPGSPRHAGPEEDPATASPPQVSLAVMSQQYRQPAKELKLPVNPHPRWI